MKCLKENCDGIAIKYGVRGKKAQQAYLCKKCGYHFTLERKARLSEDEKLEILYLSLCTRTYKSEIAMKFNISRRRVWQIVNEYNEDAKKRGLETIDEVIEEVINKMNLI